MILLDQIRNQLLTLTGCRAIANRNDLDVILADHIQQLLLGAFQIRMFLAKRNDLVHR